MTTLALSSECPAQNGGCVALILSLALVDRVDSAYAAWTLLKLAVI